MRDDFGPLYCAGRECDLLAGGVVVRDRSPRSRETPRPGLTEVAGFFRVAAGFVEEMKLIAAANLVDVNGLLDRRV